MLLSIHSARMGCNKELSGPKRQVFRVCVFVFLGGVLGLHCYEGISAVVVSKGCSLVVMHDLLIAVASQCRAQALGQVGFRGCSIQAQQLWLLCSRAQAQQLWYMGLASLQHVGSSWTRDTTSNPCITRQILNHWTIRKVLILFLMARLFQ